MVLAFVHDTEAVGHYVVASVLAELLLIIPAAITTLLLSEISSGKSTNGSLVANTCRHVILITVLAAIGLGLGGVFCIPVIFGIKYLSSVVPFLILLPGTLCLGVNNIVGTYLLGAGRPGLATRITAVGVAIGVVLDLVLIPRGAEVGAALAATISSFALATLITREFLRLSGCSIRESFLVQPRDLALYQSGLIRAWGLVSSAVSARERLGQAHGNKRHGS